MNPKDEKYYKKQIKARIVDLFWEGRMPNYKYVVDKNYIERIDAE